MKIEEYALTSLSEGQKIAVSQVVNESKISEVAKDSPDRLKMKIAKYSLDRLKMKIAKKINKTMGPSIDESLIQYGRDIDLRELDIEWDVFFELHLSEKSSVFSLTSLLFELVLTSGLMKPLFNYLYGTKVESLKTKEEILDYLLVVIVAAILR